MSDTEVDPIWNTTEPFAEQTRAEPKSRKKKNGTEAEIALPEIDETFEPVPQEPGELIDGSEDDISAFEEQDPTAPIEVAVDLDDGARAPVKTVAQKRSDDMADKTKADMIRDEIAKRKEKGESQIRPRDIIAALKERGVTVTAPQVSVTLRDFDKKPAKAVKTAKAAKDKEPKRALAKVRSAAAPSAPAANGPSYQALEATAAFVSGSGGLEPARQLLDAYARLFNPAG